MAELEIYPDSVRRAGAELRAVGQQVRNRFSTLQGAVAGLGSPWGGDEIGTLIGTAYLGIEQAAGESYASVVDSFDDFAVGLVALADSVERTDVDNAGSFHQIGGELGGPAAAR